MRIVITGATGNLGTSLLSRLADDGDVREVVGIARRAPRTHGFARTRFVRADVAEDPLVELMRGADAVVHLAWRLQPSHDIASLDRTNVDGSRRVFDAVTRAGVPTLLYASSVGTYAPGPKQERVDESWSTAGVPRSTYSRQKSDVERMLDEVEARHPNLRVVRFRPGLVFKREAASGIRRLFLGPLVPKWAFDRRVLRWVPDHPRLRFQAVHSLDVGEAFRLALHRDVRGPINLAADPILDPDSLARALDARPVAVPEAVLRAAAASSWHLRLQSSEPGWIDLAFGVPLMSAARATAALGWRPRWRSDEALVQLLEGLRHGDGLRTPPLLPARGPARFFPADPSSRVGRLSS